jgi:hypothetical protein
VVLYAHEDIGEVGEGVDVVGLAGSDERVQTREVLASLIVADEEIVLAPESGGSQGALRGIVVCVLKSCVRLVGESPARSTVAPTGSTRGGSGGDE